MGNGPKAAHHRDPMFLKLGRSVRAHANANPDQLDAGSNPCVGTDLEEIREHVNGAVSPGVTGR